MSSVSALNSVLSSATTASTAPTVNISSLLAAAAGVATAGIDVNAAVAAALYADRAAERTWQAQQASLSAQTTAMTAMQTATASLSTDMQSLNSLTGPLSARVVSSSNASAVTATAASGTAAGNHVVVVRNLASTGAWYSDVAATSTSPLSAESFTISTTAGASATITTGSGVNTLADLVTNINSRNLGLTASVVVDSTGSRLALVSNTSGSAADFSITSAPTTTTAWSSPPVASSTAPLAANTFTITDGGTTTTINVASGETLAQLATDINGKSLGVNASVVSDSQGYHLSVVSGDGSTPFTISMPTFGFSQAFAGVNAALTADGILISSASNTVTGAIGGVTLNLLNSTAGSQVNLAVASDKTQITTAIQSFVADYNTAVSQVNAQFSFNGATGGQGVLGSDPTVRQLQNTLLGAVSYVNTAGGSTTSVSTMASLGITVNTDGTLAIDNSSLNNVVANSPNDVQQFFQGASLNGFASSVSTQLGNFTNPSNGAFTVDLSSISHEYQDIAAHISSFESIYIARQQATLTAMYSAAEIALQQLPTQMAQIQAELGNNSSGK